MSRGANRPTWATRIEEDLGRSIRVQSPVSGGDVASSHRVELDDSTRLFVKQYPLSIDGIGDGEAAGLAWLRDAQALRVPEVLAHGSNWLALEWIDSAAPCKDFAERLGEGIAVLHGHHEDECGWDRNNWIGTLFQDNAPQPDWPRFYAESRLQPLLERALRAGSLPASVQRRLERLIEGIEDLVGQVEPSSRLHGDLWAGNVLSDEKGRPCLIDPAVYAGHREVDLAMMRLFGGFDARTFQAYGEAKPFAAGAAERVALYQVYPLLVHVCLFGSSYVEQLDRAARAALDRRTFEYT